MIILFLPKYASHLNAIERVWIVMKAKVGANHRYLTLATLHHAVQQSGPPTDGTSTAQDYALCHRAVHK
jgi:hypothetical protein